MTISREALAAYADGELKDDAARAVEAAIEADPEIRRQFEAHRALRARLSAHFAPLVDRPVPEHLLAPLNEAAAKPSNVVDFTAAVRSRDERTSRKTKWSRFAGPALAASLVLALVSIVVARHTPAGYAQGEVASALDEQLVATQSSDARVRILLSFRDEKGLFCRGFSTASQSGIACHDDRGWRLRQTIGNTQSAQTEYRQAGSADPQVMAAIQDLADGRALDANAESNARQAGWRN